MEASPSVLVVGAGGGIGRELCRRLAARGARLTLAGRDGAKLQSLATELGAATEQVDAKDFDAMRTCVEGVVARHGRIDAVVNLAGSILLKAAHTTSASEWDDVVGQNLRTAFSVVRAAASLMGAQGGGSIVLMSSAAARIGLANHEAIAAAKAGVLGLTLSAAATYAPRGVRINAVAPGLVDSPMSARLVANEASRKVSEALHALGRIGQPAEVAELIAFLLEPTQTWITGQVFGIDGGLGTLRSR